MRAYAAYPPSTSKLAPVMKLASGSVMRATKFAISAVCAYRPERRMLHRARRPWLYAGFMSVSVRPS